jgi:hypothetical protein
MLPPIAPPLDIIKPCADAADALNKPNKPALNNVRQRKRMTHSRAEGGPATTEFYARNRPTQATWLTRFSGSSDFNARYLGNRRFWESFFKESGLGEHCRANARHI